MKTVFGILAVIVGGMFAFIFALAMLFAFIGSIASPDESTKTTTTTARIVPDTVAEGQKEKTAPETTKSEFREEDALPIAVQYAWDKQPPENQRDICTMHQIDPSMGPELFADAFMSEYEDDPNVPGTITRDMVVSAARDHFDRVCA